VPKRINVYRDGLAAWIEVDGWTMPPDWIDRVSVDIEPGEGPDTVTVTLWAEHISTDAKDTDDATCILDEVIDHGETQSQTAQTLAGDRIRLPVKPQVPDP
jgi:hypothetical protein